jgi:hypothetical protein
MAKKKSYSDRTDREKIESNWTKTLGLLGRKEYSMAVVRAAIAVELSANLIIREELVRKRNLSEKFVDSLLIWANGLQGKFQRLIIPVARGTALAKAVEGLQSKWQLVNEERNKVVHRGQFKGEETAKQVLRAAHEVMISLVPPYEPTFKLKQPPR